MFEEFREDVARYRSYGESRFRVALNPAVWCIFWYRLGKIIYREKSYPLLRLPLKAMHLLGATFLDAFLQMRLNVRAEIGPGLLIAHCGGITLHPDVVIGRNCDLAHHVTIGTRGVGSQGTPRFGDNVYVGTNAVLIGSIHVGDYARIGANSLVVSDVPIGATAIGVPAQITRIRKHEDTRSFDALQCN
jgi:serine O-acetyltransferase